MKNIQVIGTAVVNNVKWVKRLYHSIDYPVDNFFIINNNGRGEIDYDLDLLKKEINPYVKKVFVSHMPSNIGVASSWNLIIKSFMMSNHWIIVNDDVAFTPGLLEEMAFEATDEEIGIIHPQSGDFALGAWDLFLIKDWVIKSHGLFDENFYPAYCEDIDYLMRIFTKPIKRKIGLKTNYLHGEGFSEEYNEHGSQTRKASAELEEKLISANMVNFDYMTQKWGPDWRTCQPWSHPFDYQIDTLKFNTFDLEFVRQKNLGF